MKRWLHSHEKTLYRAVNAGLLICIVLLGAGSYLGIDKPGMRHFIVAFGVLGILTGMNGVAVRSRLICLAVLLILLCAGIAADPVGSLTFWRTFLFWLAGKEKAVAEWTQAYVLLQTAMLTAACYLLQVLFDRLPLLKAGVAGFPMGILIFCMIYRREVNPFGMAFMVCFLLLVWVEWVQRSWERRQVEERSVQVRIFWILPFLGLYLVLLLILPAPEKPYDWNWAKAIYRQLQESFRTYTQKAKWGNQEGFHMAFTGFPQEGTLGGDLQGEAKEVMAVQVSPSAADYLYLTGMLYDTFDGREWSRKEQGYENEVFLDTAETLYAVRNYNERYQRDYLKDIRVTVRYEDFNTGYVFAPLKTWDMEDASGADADIVCEDGVLRWNGRKGYGTEYSLRYFAMNTGQPQFELFLEEAVRPEESRRSAESGSEETVNRKLWEEINKECEGRSGRTFTLQDLENYEMAVRESYLGEVRLSGELADYLKDIVKGAETDLEKLKAIESYLSTFCYTLTPGDLPKSVRNAEDFLDYFLLESRQGYCTYFASAFVLLARAEGIPARYVQGYCVPMGERGEAAVYSYMAHAWPEAYLEGIGWIPFEPTPGYGSRRHDPWTVQQRAESLAGESAFGDWSLRIGPDGGTEEDTGGIAGMEIAAGEDSEENPDFRYFWQLSGAAVLAALLSCGGLLALDNGLGRRQYRKMQPEERLRAEVFRNLKIISMFGAKRESWETLEEFRERIRYLPGRNGESRELPLAFLESYEGVVYGRKTAGEEKIKEAVNDREGLLELLKQERKWSWVYCKVRLYLGKYRF